jgi:hypothetical protein
MATLLGEFAKFLKATISSVVYVRPSVRMVDNMVPTARICDVVNFDCFSKIFLENPNFVKIQQE